MRIVTYNVNSINARLPNLLRWLQETTPDVVCLQELKAPQEKFPESAIRDAGYGAIWHGQKSYNGVAILTRNCEPVEIRRVLPGDPEDAHSRYIEATVNGILIGCLYVPNGNPQPGPKFDYKLNWLKRLSAHARKLLKANVPVAMIGDYNVAPTDEDIYPTRSWDNDALIQPQSRAAYARLVKQGWTDALRETHPDQRIYSFWDYKRYRWPRDAGLRLDHILLGPILARRLKAAGVDRAERGRDGASDHAPVWVELQV